MISLIFARDLTNVIGDKENNCLPWKISQDLTRFKILTHNRTVIMGKNTFESLNCVPLKNRKNIVVTNKKYDNVQTISCLSDYIIDNKNEDIFVIGGEHIFYEALPFTDIIYETIVYHKTENLENKVIFNYPLPNDKFKRIYKGSLIKANELNQYDNIFNIYSRIKEY